MRFFGDNPIPFSDSHSPLPTIAPNPGLATATKRNQSRECTNTSPKATSARRPHWSKVVK